jgi:hypothetical protein
VQPNHAVIMASFALECRKTMRDVTIKLERELGPETADDLCLRIGLHSGPGKFAMRFIAMCCV